MAWLFGFLLGIVGLALVAVVAEWLILGVSAVVLATWHNTRGRADPSNPRNLERSLVPEDVRDLRALFAALLAEAPYPPVPRRPPAPR